MSITSPKNGEIKIWSGQYNKKCGFKISPKSLQRTLREIPGGNIKSEYWWPLII